VSWGRSGCRRQHDAHITHRACSGSVMSSLYHSMAQKVFEKYSTATYLITVTNMSLVT